MSLGFHLRIKYKLYKVTTNQLFLNDSFKSRQTRQPMYDVFNGLVERRSVLIHLVAYFTIWVSYSLPSNSQPPTEKQPRFLTRTDSCACIFHCLSWAVSDKSVQDTWVWCTPRSRKEHREATPVPMCENLLLSISPALGTNWYGPERAAQRVTTSGYASFSRTNTITWFNPLAVGIPA